MVVSPAVYDTPEWKNLSTSARFICLYLWTRADENGIAYPSIAKISNDLKMSKNTVVEHTPELEKNGFMKKTTRPGSSCHYTMSPYPKQGIPKQGIPNEVLPKQNDTLPYIGNTPYPKQGHKQIKNISITDNIGEVYNIYPGKCPKTGRSTGKCTKDKKRISTLLKTESNVKERIEYYLQDCKRHDIPLKNLGTLLNNLPEIPEETAAPEPVTTNDNDKWMKIFNEQRGAA